MPPQREGTDSQQAARGGDPQDGSVGAPLHVLSAVCQADFAGDRRVTPTTDLLKQRRLAPASGHVVDRPAGHRSKQRDQQEAKG